MLLSFLHSNGTKEECTITNDDISNFYASLTKGLEDLQLSLGPEFMTAEWIKKAIEFVKFCHSSILGLIEKLQLPISARGEDWMNEYMDETVKLLDIANVLKKGIAGLEIYHMKVEVALRTFEPHDGVHVRELRACRDELMRIDAVNKQLVQTRLEADGKLFLNLSDKEIEGNFSKWSRFWGAMYTLKSINSFMGRLLILGVVHSGSSDKMICENIEFGSPWARCLYGMQQRVIEEVRKKAKKRMIFLREFDALEAALTGVDEGLLKQRSDEFKMGIETLEWSVNDLFDEVVEGRNKLLAHYSQ